MVKKTGLVRKQLKPNLPIDDTQLAYEGFVER